MKKFLLFIGVFFAPFVAKAAFKTDAMNVTTSSITINGTTYQWLAGPGNSGQCLKSDGGNPPALIFDDCTTPMSFMFLNDGTFLLLEDGQRLNLENP